mgnify:CR=1 FL=1
MTTITIDRELLEQALAALTYQGTMWSTRRQRRMAAVDALRAALEAPATAPARKPMPILEVNARWEQSVLDITRLQYYQVIREAEAFHGITGGKP